MNKVFQVAGYRFMVSGERLCAAIDRIEGFKPFLVEDSDYLFSFVEGVNVMWQVFTEPDTVRHSSKVSDIRGNRWSNLGEVTIVFINPELYLL
mgnify:CR=1 FL=1